MGNTEDYSIAEDYQEMASDIIREKRPDILEAGIAVGFLSCNKEKRKGKTHLVLGECRKVSGWQEVFCPYDFIIIIYDLNCEGLTDDQMKILIWHELEHIGIDEHGDHYVAPHDIEDFRDIIDAHGLDWAEKENVPRGTMEDD